jgi:hypothetical protein
MLLNNQNRFFEKKKREREQVPGRVKGFFILLRVSTKNYVLRIFFFILHCISCLPKNCNFLLIFFLNLHIYAEEAGGALE